MTDAPDDHPGPELPSPERPGPELPRSNATDPAITDPMTSDSEAAAPPIDRRMLEYLVCPVTRGSLVYDPARRELISRGAHLAFPIHGGIPVMLIDEARRLDD